MSGGSPGFLKRVDEKCKVRTGPATDIHGLNLAATAPELVKNISAAHGSGQVHCSAAAIIACVQITVRRARQQRHNLRPAFLGRHVQRSCPLRSRCCVTNYAALTRTAVLVHASRTLPFARKQSCCF